MYSSRIRRLALGNFLWEGLERLSNPQQAQLKKGRLESETRSPRACAVICGICYWGQNMTFLEASWLGGICATAYPADCSWCRTPVAFYKTPSLSPCGPSTLQLLCTQETVLGSIQCNPYNTALSYVFCASSNLHCASIKGQGKKGIHRANTTTETLSWGGGNQREPYRRGKACLQ